MSDLNIFEKLCKILSKFIILYILYSKFLFILTLFDLGLKHKKSPKKGTPENPKEYWNKEKHRAKLYVQTSIHNMYLVKWGVDIYLKDEYGNSNKIELTNSCSIDNSIQILYSLFKFNDNAEIFIRNHSTNNMPAKIFIKMCQHLENRNCSKAKALWMENVLKMTPNKGIIDIYGNECAQFMEFFGEFYKMARKIECEDSNCENNRIYSLSMSALIFPDTDDMLEKLNNTSYCNCVYTSCRKLCKKEYFWEGEPPPFFSYEIPRRTNQKKKEKKEEKEEIEKIDVREAQIPYEQIICGQAYQLYALTLFEHQHFTTIFFDGKNRFEYNGRPTPTFVPHIISKTARVSSVWLIKL